MTLPASVPSKTTWDSLQIDHKTFLKYELREFSEYSVATEGTQKRSSRLNTR
jgi:hypothetical protein